MFVGHGLLAFAFVVFLGRAVAWPRERVFSLALLAGAFATVPDVDMLYAPIGLLGGVDSVFAASSAFWAASTVVHRSVTHSLVVGVLAALAFGLASVAIRAETPARRRRAAGALAASLLLGVVLTATVVTGALAGVVMALFLAAGTVVTWVASNRGIQPAAVAGTALLGLCTHPFGDLFTGEPPAMLYPFDATLVGERVALHADPTLNLLGAFGVELLTIWLGAFALLVLYDRRFREHVDRRALLGVGYAGAVLALPAPTLDTSYHFVFSVLALGTVGPVRSRPLTDCGSRLRRACARRPAIDDWPTAVVTGLTAITLGAVAYTLGYVLVF